MINRCVECGSICPDFSDLCDCCAFIDEEDKLEEEDEDEWKE